MTNAPSPIIKVSQLTHQYPHSDIPILKDLNFSLNAGEIISIMGPSGCGKSTLLSILSGFIKPTSGEILISNVNLSNASHRKISELQQKKLGFIFQNYYLLPDLNARENIMAKGVVAGIPTGDLNTKVDQWLNTFNLTHRQSAYPNTLSGGEQQRIAFIRAVISNPAILLCDEPTGNLDDRNRDLIISQFLELKHRHNMSIIIVTHDSTFSQISDRQIELGTLK